MSFAPQDQPLYFYGEVEPSRNRVSQDRTVSTYNSQDALKQAIDEAARESRDLKFVPAWSEHNDGRGDIGDLLHFYLSKTGNLGIVGVVADPEASKEMQRKMNSNWVRERPLMGLSSGKQFQIEGSKNLIQDIKDHTLREISLVSDPDAAQYGSFVTFASSDPRAFYDRLRQDEASGGIAYMAERDKTALHSMTFNGYRSRLGQQNNGGAGFTVYTLASKTGPGKQEEVSEEEINKMKAMLQESGLGRRMLLDGIFEPYFKQVKTGQAPRDDNKSDGAVSDLPGVSATDSSVVTPAQTLDPNAVISKLAEFLQPFTATGRSTTTVAASSFGNQGMETQQPDNTAPKAVVPEKEKAPELQPPAKEPVLKGPAKRARPEDEQPESAAKKTGQQSKKTAVADETGTQPVPKEKPAEQKKGEDKVSDAAKLLNDRKKEKKEKEQEQQRESEEMDVDPPENKDHEQAAAEFEKRKEAATKVVSEDGKTDIADDAEITLTKAQLAQLMKTSAEQSEFIKSLREEREQEKARAEEDKRISQKNALDLKWKEKMSEIANTGAPNAPSFIALLEEFYASEDMPQSRLYEKADNWLTTNKQTLVKTTAAAAAKKSKKQVKFAEDDDGLDAADGDGTTVTDEDPLKAPAYLSSEAEQAEVNAKHARELRSIASAVGEVDQVDDDEDDAMFDGPVVQSKLENVVAKQYYEQKAADEARAALVKKNMDRLALNTRQSGDRIHQDSEAMDQDEEQEEQEEEQEEERDYEAMETDEPAPPPRNSRPISTRASGGAAPMDYASYTKTAQNLDREDRQRAANPRILDPASSQAATGYSLSEAEQQQKRREKGLLPSTAPDGDSAPLRPKVRVDMSSFFDFIAKPKDSSTKSWIPATHLRRDLEARRDAELQKSRQALQKHTQVLKTQASKAGKPYRAPKDLPTEKQLLRRATTVASQETMRRFGISDERYEDGGGLANPERLTMSPPIDMTSINQNLAAWHRDRDARYRDRGEGRPSTFGDFDEFRGKTAAEKQDLWRKMWTSDKARRAGLHVYNPNTAVDMEGRPIYGPGGLVPDYGHVNDETLFFQGGEANDSIISEDFQMHNLYGRRDLQPVQVDTVNNKLIMPHLAEGMMMR